MAGFDYRWEVAIRRGIMYYQVEFAASKGVVFDFEQYSVLELGIVFNTNYF